LLEVRPRWRWRWDCECRCPRSCAGEPVHGFSVSLLPELSTLPRLQLQAVPTTKGGSHTSAQARTQKSLDVGRCPLLTLSGPALAFLGQHSPESGPASSCPTAPVSKEWDAHSREGHAQASRATLCALRQATVAAGDRSTSMIQAPTPSTTRGGATETHVTHSCGFDPNWYRKASTCLAILPGFGRFGLRSHAFRDMFGSYSTDASSFRYLRRR